MLAFQIADIYQVQAFRGHEKQYFRLASAWSVVFLIVIGVSFFAKAGDQFSRVWLGSFYVIGLVALLAFRRALFLLVRRWTREGRLTRRTAIVGGGDAGEALVSALIRDSAIPTCASSACSTTAATTARRKPSPARASSAPSTIWSNSRGAPASIW